MLTEFENEGKSRGYFTYKLIKDLPHSQCKKSIVEVIDYDYVKKLVTEKLCKIGHENMLKSCDGLKLINEAKRIDFIEIKGLQEYINRYGSGRKKTSPEKLAKNFELDMKIIDSYYILHHLINEFSSIIGMKTAKKLKRIKPTYILLTDVNLRNSRLRFAVTLNYLSTRSGMISKIGLIKELESQLNTCMQNSTTITQQNLLFCEAELDEHYKNLAIRYPI